MVSVNLTYVGLLNVIVKQYYEVSQKLTTSRYRKLGSPACVLFIGLQVSPCQMLCRFNRFGHFPKKTLIIVGREICSFNRPSSVGRKTECCVRYTTETVGPTEFNFDMYN